MLAGKNVRGQHDIPRQTYFRGEFRHQIRTPDQKIIPPNNKKTPRKSNLLFRDVHRFTLCNQIGRNLFRLYQ